jgi:hypothetical protein
MAIILRMLVMRSPKGSLVSQIVVSPKHKKIRPDYGVMFNLRCTNVNSRILLYLLICCVVVAQAIAAPSTSFRG